MFAPSVIRRAVVGSDAGRWCETSHGSVTSAPWLHAAASALGSSGGAAESVGTAMPPGLAVSAWAHAAAPAHTTSAHASIRTIAIAALTCYRFPPNRGEMRSAQLHYYRINSFVKRPN
jgi:hypothetical protein